MFNILALAISGFLAIVIHWIVVQFRYYSLFKMGRVTKPMLEDENKELKSQIVSLKEKIEALIIENEILTDRFQNEASEKLIRELQLDESKKEIVSLKAQTVPKFQDDLMIVKSILDHEDPTDDFDFAKLGLIDIEQTEIVTPHDPIDVISSTPHVANFSERPIIENGLLEVISSTPQVANFSERPIIGNGIGAAIRPSHRFCVRKSNLSSSAEILEHEEYVIGDSIVKRIDPSKTFRGVISIKESYPGAKIHHLKRELKRIPLTVDKKTNITIHVGSNNLERGASKKILQDFGELIETAKCRFATVRMSSIIPRKDSSVIDVYSVYINNELKNLCIRKGVSFIDNDNKFIDSNNQIRSNLYYHDGLHLNSNGNVALALNFRSAANLNYRGAVQSLPV